MATLRNQKSSKSFILSLNKKLKIHNYSTTKGKHLIIQFNNKKQSAIKFYELSADRTNVKLSECLKHS